MEELTMGEGIGYRPLTLAKVYSETSVSIDTLFIYIYKNNNNQLCLITFDYNFG